MLSVTLFSILLRRRDVAYDGVCRFERRHAFGGRSRRSCAHGRVADRVGNLDHVRALA